MRTTLVCVRCYETETPPFPISNSTTRQDPPPSKKTQQPAPQPGPSNKKTQVAPQQGSSKQLQKIASRPPAQPPSKCVIFFLLGPRRVLCLTCVIHHSPAGWRDYSFVEYAFAPLLAALFFDVSVVSRDKHPGNAPEKRKRK